jgi:hypothetical protein
MNAVWIYRNKPDASTRMCEKPEWKRSPFLLEKLGVSGIKEGEARMWHGRIGII